MLAVVIRNLCHYYSEVWAESRLLSAIKNIISLEISPIQKTESQSYKHNEVKCINKTIWNFKAWKSCGLEDCLQVGV